MTHVAHLLHCLQELPSHESSFTPVPHEHSLIGVGGSGGGEIPAEDSHHVHHSVLCELCTDTSYSCLLFFTHSGVVAIS